MKVDIKLCSYSITRIKIYKIEKTAVSDATSLPAACKDSELRDEHQDASMLDGPPQPTKRRPILFIDYLKNQLMEVA